MLEWGERGNSIWPLCRRLSLSMLTVEVLRLLFEVIILVLYKKMVNSCCICSIEKSVHTSYLIFHGYEIIITKVITDIKLFLILLCSILFCQSVNR